MCMAYNSSETQTPLPNILDDLSIPLKVRMKISIYSGLLPAEKKRFLDQMKNEGFTTNEIAQVRAS